uniref:G-protein coupled receptors family 1 profile domain-containing protein n=1 Tax=Erpetoichthys calabaricus TaxID=27687 RepID=A0A8C4RJ72_ERPCA
MSIYCDNKQQVYRVKQTSKVFNRVYSSGPLCFSLSLHLYKSMPVNKTLITKPTALMCFTKMEISEVLQLYCPLRRNITCSKIYSSLSVNVTLYVIFITGIILAVCGNLALIISISHFKQLHTPSNVLILSMAFADFIIGIFNMPVQLLIATEVTLLCFSFSFTDFSVTNISVYHLLLLAGDRYYAVCYPLFYSMKVTVKVIWMLVAIVWSWSIFYSFVSMYIYTCLVTTRCTSKYGVNVQFIFSLFDIFSTLLMPFLIIFGLYAKIFVVARKHAKAIQNVAAQGESGEKARIKGFQKTQHKAAKTISIIICVFISCCFPVYLYSLLSSFVDFVFSRETYRFLSELSFLNSAFNPMIYGFFYPWFWKNQGFVSKALTSSTQQSGLLSCVWTLKCGDTAVVTAIKAASTVFCLLFLFLTNNNIRNIYFYSTFSYK